MSEEDKKFYKISSYSFSREEKKEKYVEEYSHEEFGEIATRSTTC